MTLNLSAGLSLVAAAGVLCGSLEAADGVLIVEQTTAGGETHQIQIERHRMRAGIGGGVKRLRTGRFSNEEFLGGAGLGRGP